MSNFSPLEFVEQQYQQIIAEEAKLSFSTWDVPEATEIWNATQQIAEYITSGTVPRSYIWNYHVSDVEPRSLYESVAAHTNLMAAIADLALCYRYGPYFQYTNDGYTYREIMEAIRRHDLPENVTGDIPDDGARDDFAKSDDDTAYQLNFSQLAPSRNAESERKVRRLLQEMDGKTSPTGKLIYLADKVSAVLAVLYYDSIAKWPHKLVTEDNITLRDIEEMRLCDFEYERNGYLASEMWAIDYFETRRLVRYDDIGYITALLVMFTLQVRRQWYSWRESKYSEDYYSSD